MEQILEGFWAKVDVRGPDECWEFSTNRDDYGYGHFYNHGRFPGQPRRIKAHRLAYQLLVGPIPDGMEVCHRCDNPPCVNPAHLWLGTHKENMHDMWAKGRGNPGRNGGEACGRAKLKWPQVRTIRAMRASGTTYQEIADIFGISQSQVGNIVRGKHWLPPEEGTES